MILKGSPERLAMAFLNNISVGLSARFEHSLTNAKILQHGMLTEITSSMPELEARVQGDVAGSSWQDEVDRDYEDAAEDVVAEIVG